MRIEIQAISKARRNQNCLPIPNEIFSFGLKHGALCVYLYLLYLEDRKTYQCWPSYKTIGKAVGMSQNTVRKYVGILEQRHFITTQPTTIRTENGEVHNGNLLYTIRPIQEVIDYYNEQQMRKLEMSAEKQRITDQLKKNAVLPRQKTRCAT